MFALIKKVLQVRSISKEGQPKAVDVKWVATMLREMKTKINCTLQGNYFSKRE
jgi:hypothetical protein